jgi:hypothetical protein
MIAVGGGQCAVGWCPQGKEDFPSVIYQYFIWHFYAGGRSATENGY